MTASKDKYKEIILTEEVAKKTINAFRSLKRHRANLETKQEKYKKKASIPIEDRIPYRSSSYIENDVRITGGSKISMTERATIELKAEEEELLKYSLFVAKLEEILSTAITKAVMFSKNSAYRIKLRSMLELNLIDGVSRKDLNIGSGAFSTYRRIAVIEAAIALGYLDIEDAPEGEEK